MARISGWSSVLVAVLVLAPSVEGQVVPGETDTFDSDTEGWFTGGGPGGVTPTPAQHSPTGGPGGADDGFMRLVSTGVPGAMGRLSVSNAGQWAGDYPGAGVGRIGMWVNNFSSTDLFLRMAFETLESTGPTNIAFSTTPILLPAGSGWSRIFFPILAGDLSNFPLPGSTIEGALANASLIRLYHSPEANSPNPFEPIPLVAAELGVDDITALSAVPEPGTLLLLGTGLAMVIGVQRRRIARSDRV